MRSLFSFWSLLTADLSDHGQIIYSTYAHRQSRRYDPPRYPRAEGVAADIGRGYAQDGPVAQAFRHRDAHVFAPQIQRTQDARQDRADHSGSGYGVAGE